MTIMVSGTPIRSTFGYNPMLSKMLLCLSLPGETSLNPTVRKLLRQYQAHLIADVCRASGPVLVEQPTGAGKTIQIVTLVAMQLGQRFTHAVIAPPQQQIEHAFVHPDYRLVAFPPCQGVAAPDIEIPEGLILGARNSKQLNSVYRLIAYLRHYGSQDHALACTHAALNRLKPERMPNDLSGKALFLDDSRIRRWAEADDGRPIYMFNLIHFFPQLRSFPGAPEFKGTPQESNAYYMKRLAWLWLSHAAYPIFDGVTQAENLINMQPERTWGQVTVARYRNRRTFLKLLSDPAYAPVEPYKFMAMELDLVPVSGRLVIPDLRWLLGGSFIIIFLLIEWVRAVWLR
jgi:hypothetical protein